MPVLTIHEPADNGCGQHVDRAIVSLLVDEADVIISANNRPNLNISAYFDDTLDGTPKCVTIELERREAFDLAARLLCVILLGK